MGFFRYGLQGYVVIRVKGARLETFVNMANREGIVLSNVSRPVPDRLYCSVSVKDFRRLRPIIKSLRLAVEIRRRRGLPFLARRLFQHQALMVGIVAVGLLLYLASGFIWFINLDNVPPEVRVQVKAVLGQAGITTGVRSRGIEVRELERLLLTELESLSWAAVEIRGTALFVEAVLRTSFEEKRDQPCHLVAAKSGVVDSLITFAGLPVVRKGQTVQAGDVLISGVVPLDYFGPEVYNNENVAPGPDSLLGRAGRWGYLFADGLVQVLTWYDAAAEVRYASQQRERTGRQTCAYYLGLGERTLALGRKVSPYVEFETEEQTWYWPLPWRLGEIRLVRLVYRELQTVQIKIEPEEAKLEALRLARAKIRAQLPPEATILDEQIRFLTEDGRVCAEVLVSAREDIGLHRRVAVGEPPPANWEGFVIND